MMVKKFIVTEAHKAATGGPLIAARGSILSYERRKTDWTGWLYCTDQDGNSGWVPESWMRVDEHFSMMERDYDSTELSVSPGDLFLGKIIESGWVQGFDVHGNEGWVPLECLQQLETENPGGEK